MQTVNASQAPTINEQKHFSFSPTKIDVRYEMIDGEPWFVANDVCNILGIVNSRDALSRLEDDEKGVGITDTLGGKQEMNIVNESGLYNLIFQSRKPEAKKFRKWVTSEVLPSIRKTGKYDIRKSIKAGSIGNLLDHVRKMERDGKVWYRVSDLLLITGRTRRSQSVTKKLHKMRENGTGFKLEEWPEAWYVSDPKPILGVKEVHVLRAAIANYLSEGGVL